MKTFACKKDFCNISEVKARTVLVPSADHESNQIKVFLTNCENIIYNRFEENSTPYTVQKLSYANTPTTVIDENFVAQNYFRGNVTIFAHTKNAEIFINQVYICQFTDPIVFKEFLSSKGDWKHFITPRRCKKLSAINVHNASYPNQSIMFHNESLSFSFVGAVQSDPPQDVLFGFRVIGEKIAGFSDANRTQSCTLNLNGHGDESECSIYLGDELAYSATIGPHDQLCVLGNGVSAGDGSFQYTPVAVELIEHKIKLNFITKIRIAFISPITIVLLLISILIAIGVLVCKRHKKDEAHHVSAVVESEPEGNRSMIAAFNVQRQNNI